MLSKKRTRVGGLDYGVRFRWHDQPHMVVDCPHDCECGEETTRIVQMISGHVECVSSKVLVQVWTDDRFADD